MRRSTIPLNLLTADVATAPFTLSVPEVTASADAEKRQISGLVISYGKPGRTSAGTITAGKGSVTLPQDMARVKLLNKHRPDGGESIGYMIACEDREDGIHATFQLGTGPIADAALTAAKERVRDALSVELSDHKLAGATLTASMLDAVALVDVPAFRDARVTTIASQSDPGKVPPSLLNGATKANAGISLTAAQDALRAMLQGDNSPDVTAALVDITHSAHLWTEPKGWLGELWAEKPFKRLFSPLVQNNPLTSFRMTGWRVTVRPGVADWAGDKAEIPTFPITTEEKNYTAVKIAGGNDIAREHYDFNDQEFIAAYLRLMRDSYDRKIDAKVRDLVINGALPVLDGAGTFTGAAITETSLIRAAIRAVKTINSSEAWGLGDGSATYVLVNDEDHMDLLDLTSQNLPVYLKNYGIDPERFIPSAAVPVGKVIAGVKSVSQSRELPGTPIRVSTTDLAHGGYDEALFGYWAGFNTDDRGIRSVAFA